MQFERSLCPICREPAQALVVTMTGRIELTHDLEGEFSQAGQALFWDTHRPVLVENQHLLRCRCGEIWLSRRTDEEPEKRERRKEPPPSGPDTQGPNSAAARLLMEILRFGAATKLISDSGLPDPSPSAPPKDIDF